MEPSNDQMTANREDDIHLRRIFLTIGEWRRYLLSKWLTVLICAFVCGGLGFLYALSKKPSYVAELTFVLEDSKSNSLSSYVGIASQFGLDLGGSSGSGVFAGDNIIEFLKSRLMVEKALLSGITIGNKTQSLADLYIITNGLNKNWDEYPKLKTLSFPVEQPRSQFSLQQDSVLGELHEIIIKKNLLVEKVDKKLSFISVKCTTRDEMFSQLFTERLVAEATNFYVQTKTKRSKSMVDMLEKKADSLESLLNRRTYSVATFRDLNLNPARSVAGVETELASRDKGMLQVIYGEVVKNLELSRTAMSQETPIIQIIDKPILPLEIVKFGKLKGIIIGTFLGGFFIVVWLILRRVYKQVMSV